MPNKPRIIKPTWVPARVPYGRRSTDNQKFYNSRPWRKARKNFLEKNPICIKCKAEGKTIAATVVDHITRIEDGGDKLNESNFQSLCKRHHDSKSGKEAHGYKENSGNK